MIQPGTTGLRPCRKHRDGGPLKTNNGYFDRSPGKTTRVDNPVECPSIPVAEAARALITFSGAIIIPDIPGFHQKHPVCTVRQTLIDCTSALIGTGIGKTSFRGKSVRIPDECPMKFDFSVLLIEMKDTPDQRSIEFYPWSSLRSSTKRAGPTPYTDMNSLLKLFKWENPKASETSKGLRPQSNMRRATTIRSLCIQSLGVRPTSRRKISRR